MLAQGYKDNIPLNSIPMHPFFAFTLTSLFAIAQTNPLFSKRVVPVCIDGISDVSLDTSKYFYEMGLQKILNDKEISKAFCYLENKEKLPKKYFTNGRYKIMISENLYELNLKEEAFCSDADAVSYKWRECDLHQFTNSPKNYKFVLFFSSISNGCFECTMVPKLHLNIDQDYFIRTRFGKKVIIRFCIKDNAISRFKMDFLES